MNPSNGLSRATRGVLSDLWRVPIIVGVFVVGEFVVVLMLSPSSFDVVLANYLRQWPIFVGVYVALIICAFGY